MFHVVKRFKLSFSLALSAVFCFSSLAKDLHEILAEHQHIACFDQPDSSFKHYHSTEHSLHDCKLSQFVFSPVIESNLEAFKIDLLEEYEFLTYPKVEFKTLNHRYSYSNKGPPGFNI